MMAIPSDPSALNHEWATQIDAQLLWADRQLNDLGQKTAAEGSLSYCILPGDAGFRRYFRLQCDHGSKSWLLVFSPPATEPNETFIALATGLRQNGVPTPTIFGVDTEQDWFLIEDFGDQWLLSALQSQPEQADVLYDMAVSALLDLQTITPNALGYRLPEYDQEMLSAEMALMPTWFVEGLLAYRLSAAEQQMFAELQQRLVQRALAQPQVLVHRDYHARNLMLTPSHHMGVIDFQDAVWGPITYDVVSLFRDCYHRWSPTQVRQWAWQYAQRAMARELLSPALDECTFSQWFDWMGLQRHIKVLGIFARLALRDGKPRYLHDLPLVMRYTLEVADAYQETQAFAAWFRQTLLPLAQTQPWYRDIATAKGQGS